MEFKKVGSYIISKMMLKVSNIGQGLKVKKYANKLEIKEVWKQL